MMPLSRRQPEPARAVRVRRTRESPGGRASAAGPLGSKGEKGRFRFLARVLPGSGRPACPQSRLRGSESAGSRGAAWSRRRVRPFAQPGSPPQPRAGLRLGRPSARGFCGRFTRHTPCIAQASAQLPPGFEPGGKIPPSQALRPGPATVTVATLDRGPTRTRAACRHQREVGEDFRPPDTANAGPGPGGHCQRRAPAPARGGTSPGHASHGPDSDGLSLLGSDPAVDARPSTCPVTGHGAPPAVEVARPARAGPGRWDC
jgi:hypothetical protein